MIDKHKKLKILKTILQSPEFKETHRYQELLTYLVQASENDDLIKETTIAMDLFGKDVQFDPQEDPTIRVYVSNLRKKLDHYYLTKGKNETVRLRIPKGHYHVEFVPVKPVREKISIIYKYLTYIFFIPAVIILTAVIIYQSKHIGAINTENIISADHPVWEEFLQKNDKPTLILIGDFFFLYERKKSNDGGYFVRDPRINSYNEFAQVLKKNPELIERFVDCNFTYLGPSTAESMINILPILWSSKNKIFMKLATELKWEEMKRHNIIFIGNFKTLYDLNKLFPKFQFKYQLFPPHLFLLNDSGDTLQTFTAMQGGREKYKKDYGVVVKHLGPENNTILLMMGFDEVGITEAVKTVTDPLFPSRIENKFIKGAVSKPFLFEMFIEVEGVDRSVFKSEIKHFRRVETG